LKLVLSKSACRRGSSLNEIENASRVKQEVASTDWPRRFIRSFAEDAKFEESREVIINPAVDAGFGATRRRRDGKAGRCGNRGNSENHQPAPRAARIWGNLKTQTPRRSRKVNGAGQPATTPGGATGSAMPRGNPEQQRQAHRRTRNSGQLEDPSPAQPEDTGTGATRGMYWQAQSEVQSFEGNLKL